MYPPSVYYHMDAVIMYCDWDSAPPCIVESDKVKYVYLNYIITQSPSVNSDHCLALTCEEGCCFLGETSLKSWLVSPSRRFFFSTSCQRRICSATFPFPALPPSHCHSGVSHTQPLPSLHTVCVSMKTRSSIEVIKWKLDIWCRLYRH